MFGWWSGSSGRMPFSKWEALSTNLSATKKKIPFEMQSKCDLYLGRTMLIVLCQVGLPFLIILKNYEKNFYVWAASVG
jgi:hypothetical protein